jgi:hypothetical protein
VTTLPTHPNSKKGRGLVGGRNSPKKGQLIIFLCS